MNRIKILLLALALIPATCSFGQALQITPGDTFVYAGTLATITDSHEQNGYLVNNTANDDSIYWRATSSAMDSVWQMSFCDPDNCYYYTSSIGNFSAKRFFAAAHSSNLIRFGVSPSCTPDSGKLTIVTWLGSDSAGTSKTLYYNASYTGSCVSGVSNVTAANLKVYPSPVTSNMTVDGLLGLKNVKVSVYDILGNPVIQKFYTQPSALTNVNTDALHSGVYFVTVESEGTRLLTRRIEKLD